MTDLELRDVIVNFLVAGRDTTACALSWFFHELNQNPAVAAKVTAEVDALFAERAAGASAVDVADFEIARDMTYTEAALLETPRLHPSVPAEGRVCIKAARLPATPTQPEITVPPGTVIQYNPYVYGRCPELWGDDVLQFKPERWLGDSTSAAGAKAADGAVDSKSAAGAAGAPGSVEFNDSTNLKRHSQWKFPTFNAGMRLCMGRGLALHEAKLLIASILRHFTLQLMPGHPAVTYQMTVTLMLKDGIKMIPTARVVSA